MIYSNKFNSGKKGALAFTQILLLLIGTIAFCYAIGSEMGEVRRIENIKKMKTGNFQNLICKQIRKMKTGIFSQLNASCDIAPENALK